MGIVRVISGGQTGADEAGLKAAAALGLKTGGWMPRGFRTDDGPRPWMRETYGMWENSSSSYQPRTRMNVIEANGTIIFGMVESPGSKLTLRLCNEFAKPALVYEFRNGAGEPPDPAPFVGWVNRYRIRTLNVAGNREKTNPGIGQYVYDFLIKVLA